MLGQSFSTKKKNKNTIHLCLYYVQKINYALGAKNIHVMIVHWIELWYSWGRAKKIDFYNERNSVFTGKSLLLLMMMTGNDGQILIIFFALVLNVLMQSTEEVHCPQKKHKWNNKNNDTAAIRFFMEKALCSTHTNALVKSWCIYYVHVLAKLVFLSSSS